MKKFKSLAVISVAFICLLLLFPTVYAQGLEMPQQIMAMGAQVQHNFWTSGESTTISQIIFSCGLIGIGFILVDRYNLKAE